MQKKIAALTLAAASMLVLSGCSTPSTTGNGGSGDRVTIVASTNIYGSLAAQIGGDRVEVTSLIDSGEKDPHSYEATARDRLAVQKADLVIENGGGYDSFMDELLDGSDAEVVTAAEHSHDFPGADAHDDHGDADHGDADGHDGHDDHDDHADDDHGDHADADDADAHTDDADGHDDHADDDHGDHADADDADAHADDVDAHTDDADAHADDADDHSGHSHIEGFNEHVWFDVHTISHVVEGIADELGELDPDGKAEYTAAAAALNDELAAIESDLDAMHETHEGEKVFITEPLPGLLAAAAGLDDIAPDGFASAVEEGSDVAPATLLEALKVIDSGDVRAVLVTAQTGGAETTRIIEAAKKVDIPVVEFSELLTADEKYAGWMRAAIDELGTALTR